MQHDRRNRILLARTHHPRTPRIPNQQIRLLAHRQTPNPLLHPNRPRASNSPEIKRFFNSLVHSLWDLVYIDEFLVRERARGLQQEAELRGDGGAVVGVAVYADAGMGLDSEVGEGDRGAECHLQFCGGRAGDVSVGFEQEFRVRGSGACEVGEEDLGVEDAVGGVKFDR
jgi:hypothetical protein